MKQQPGHGTVISKTAEAALLLLFLTKETDQRETNEKNNQRTAFADHGDCPYCGKHHDKIWIKIIHLVLWFFEKVFNVIKE